MDSLQLEQLISGYVDDELSPTGKQEVERLLQSDPEAKKLYDEFLAIRNEIQSIQRCNLPHDFQKKLFERIDAETVSISGKLVEQTTSVDFTTPVPGKSISAEQKKAAKFQWVSLLKNPRILAPSVAVLLVGLAVLIGSVANRNNQIALMPPDGPNVTVPVAPIDIEIPDPPLPGRATVAGDGSQQSLAMKDGKPILEVPCGLSAEARDGQFIPTLLADNGYSFVVRENGTKNVTVYEFEMPLNQLLPFIMMMYSNVEEFKNYKLPVGVIELLHRPSEASPLPDSHPPATSIIVRLNVTKE